MIKFPRIANFTDIDPLLMEDVTIRFVDRAEDLDGSDAVILPGTKNTIGDLAWMRANGIADKITGFRGKIPILGLCGGYQMMGAVLKDPKALEGSVPGDTPGLGFFENTTEWMEYRKRVVRNEGVLLKTGEPVTGYEIHMGISEVAEEPLFRIDRWKSSENEGSVREDELLFGTYLHGVFDKPAFRKYFLSFTKHAGESTETRETEDYDDYLEHSIEVLADTFESGFDMDVLMKIAEGVR